MCRQNSLVASWGLSYWKQWKLFRMGGQWATFDAGKIKQLSIFMINNFWKYKKYLKNSCFFSATVCLIYSYYYIVFHQLQKNNSERYISAIPASFIMRRCDTFYLQSFLRFRYLDFNNIFWLNNSRDEGEEGQTVMKNVLNWSCASRNSAAVGTFHNCLQSFGRASGVH